MTTTAVGGADIGVTTAVLVVCNFCKEKILRKENELLCKIIFIAYVSCLV